MCGRLRLMDSAHLCWQSASAHSKIVWDAPASDCDAHVLRYVVNVQSAHKGVSLGPCVKVHECSDASCKINGLSPGLSHVCQVSAFTPSGFWAPSATTVLTSNAPPTNCLRPSSKCRQSPKSAWAATARHPATASLLGGLCSNTSCTTIRRLVSDASQRCTRVRAWGAYPRDVLVRRTLECAIMLGCRGRDRGWRYA